jgi:hypothetical protein
MSTATVERQRTDRLGRLARDVSADELVASLARRDQHEWSTHVASAAGCSHPIRLTGTVTRVEQATGRITSETHTASMPDGVLYTACGNRRATICPSCAETYRADTFQLVSAGLVGGKGVPVTVATHPCVFLTVTAPSFGPVHAHRTDNRGRSLPCRPRRDTEPCEHGEPVGCFARHDEDDPLVGRPLCLDCYDHPAQAVWNLNAGELWRRTIEHANKQRARLEDAHGAKLRISYTKVAEFQARGAIHLHALVRLDGRNPKDPDELLAPPESLTPEHLALLLSDAVASTSFTTDPHPARPHGWPINWGEQTAPRPVQLRVRDVDDQGEITTTAVAAYLAKYATKATEQAGHVSTRLRPDTVRVHAALTTHVGRQIDACWHLGDHPGNVDRDAWAKTWGRLQRWAHMLGFGGHFSTRSRRYSTTLTALRQARREWQRSQATAGPEAEEPADEHHDEDTTEVIVTSLVYAGIGWHTTADALLANTAAAHAREHRRTAREELTTLD